MYCKYKGSGSVKLQNPTNPIWWSQTCCAGLDIKYHFVFWSKNYQKPVPFGVNVRALVYTGSEF